MAGMARWDTATARSKRQPKKVEAFAGHRVVAVAVSSPLSLAVTADGGLWSWGSGDGGRLGHGDEQMQLLPKKIEVWATSPPAADPAAESEPESDSEEF